MAESLAPADRTHSQPAPTQLLLDILIVIAVSVLAYVLEDFANDRGWISMGPDAVGVSAVLGGALAAVALVLGRGGSFRDLGFKRPKRWALVPVQVVAVLAAFIAAQALLPLLVSALFTVPQPDMSRYDSIAGNLSAALTMALLLPLTASIPEEIIYRGFLIGRLSELFRQRPNGAALSVLIQALLFCSAHFTWGIGGMVLTFMMGLIWGAAYLLCDRNLWIVIFAHSGGHILFVTQLYLGESIAF
jgi:membrane protease YdiL (CAAX protease family)